MRLLSGNKIISLFLSFYLSLPPYLFHVSAESRVRQVGLEAVNVGAAATRLATLCSVAYQ